MCIHACGIAAMCGEECRSAKEGEFVGQAGPEQKCSLPAFVRV